MASGGSSHRPPGVSARMLMLTREQQKKGLLTPSILRAVASETPHSIGVQHSSLRPATQSYRRPAASETPQSMSVPLASRRRGRNQGPEEPVQPQSESIWDTFIPTSARFDQYRDQPAPTRYDMLSDQHQPRVGGFRVRAAASEIPQSMSVPLSYRRRNRDKGREEPVQPQSESIWDTLIPTSARFDQYRDQPTSASNDMLSDQHQPRVGGFRVIDTGSLIDETLHSQSAVRYREPNRDQGNEMLATGSLIIETLHSQSGSYREPNRDQGTEMIAVGSLIDETPHFRSASYREPNRDQGTEDNYEVELTWEGDDSLHKRKKTCAKYPGHEEFIHLNAFEKRHLPRRYHHKLIVNLIRCLSTLTVRLLVQKISPHRPDPPYPPNPRQNSLGRDSCINGSGHISEAIISKEKTPCPCQECLKSGTPRTQWGKIYIHTAAHVVHDDLEAAYTTCFFFDDNDSDDQGKVIRISGMERVEIDLKEDRCWMYCYTHDLSLVRKLHDLVEDYEKLQRKVRNKYYVEWYDVEETDHKLTIIVSHPHGCGKYVSVGEFVERHELPDDPDWTRYTYTTPTCPGSSGAPVFILGKKGWFDYHHHSGVRAGTKFNQSTFGMF